MKATPHILWNLEFKPLLMVANRNGKLRMPSAWRIGLVYNTSFEVSSNACKPVDT